MVLQGNLSFHFNMGNDVQTAEGREPVGGFGAFTLSVNGGVEFNLDNPGGLNPTLSNGAGNYTLCDNRATLPSGGTDEGHSVAGTCNIANTSRGFAGLVAELGVWRHVSLVLGATMYLPFPEEIQGPVGGFTDVGSNVSRRPLTTSFWDSALPINLRLGITYKF